MILVKIAATAFVIHLIAQRQAKNGINRALENATREALSTPVAEGVPPKPIEVKLPYASIWLDVAGKWVAIVAALAAAWSL